MSQLFHRLSSLLLGDIQDGLAISIAGIHATVISILIGLGIAFVLHVNTQRSEVETEALKIAEGVNHIRFSPAWFKLMSPTSKFLENWSSHDDQIQAWLAHYWLDPTGNDLMDNALQGPPFKVYFSDFGLNHTEFKLCLMAALVLRPPFPERMVMKSGKHIGLQPTPTMVFSNVKELKDWQSLVEKKFRLLVGNINWFGIEPFTQGFDWSKEIRLRDKFWKNDPEGYSPEVLQQFRQLPKEFCVSVASIFDIARTLSYKLKRLTYLQRLNPSKAIVAITLLGSIITFLCGVIVPIIHCKTPRLLAVWIPTAFYFYFLVYLAIKVFSIMEET